MWVSTIACSNKAAFDNAFHDPTGVGVIRLISSSDAPWKVQSWLRKRDLICGRPASPVLIFGYYIS